MHFCFLRATHVSYVDVLLFLLLHTDTFTQLLQAVLYTDRAKVNHLLLMSAENGGYALYVHEPSVTSKFYKQDQKDTRLTICVLVISFS